MANETAPTPAPAPAPSTPGKATKAEITQHIADAEAIVASIQALHDRMNVNDTKFIAVTVGVASQRLQEAQRYLRNKLPLAK